MPPKKAVCIVTGEEISGTVFFDQYDDKSPVVVTGEVNGLRKGLHGFNIHEYGDKTSGCTSSGSHFNPEGKDHGGPTSTIRHVGDLGNIESKVELGKTKISIKDSVISLSGPNSILGRTLVIHASADDLGAGGNKQSKTTGNSGKSVACGVIGLAKSKK